MNKIWIVAVQSAVIVGIGALLVFASRDGAETASPTSASPASPLVSPPGVGALSLSDALPPEDDRKLDRIWDEVVSRLDDGLVGIQEAGEILEAHKSVATFGCQWFFTGAPFTKDDAKAVAQRVDYSIQAWKAGGVTELRHDTVEIQPRVDHVQDEDGRIVHKAVPQYFTIALALRCFEA